jgi:hypothetical protein
MKVYKHIPGFISKEEAEQFYTETLDATARRVMCGIKDIEWDEQDIPPDKKTYEFFGSSRIEKLFSDTLPGDGHCTVNRICWISKYKENEFINPHKDSCGDIQLIVCLKNCEEENGGFLIVRDEAGENKIFLTAGDAVLFTASQLEHYTTPLKRSERYPYPERIVAVSRYFFR